MPPRVPRFLALLVPILVGAALGSIAAGSAAPARSQGAATPAPDGAPASPLREVLFQAALEELPQPPAVIRLVRITLEPGASVPLHTHPGPEFGRVESGTLTVLVDGEAVIAEGGDGDTPQQARVPPVGEAFDLTAGDQIVYPSDVPFGFANRGQETTSVLAALIVPAGSGRPPASSWVDGTPTPDALTGVSSQILGDAVAIQWPANPHLVVLDRLALAPGQSIPGRGGPVLLAVESGRFGFALVDGQFQVTRGASGLEANATPGTEYRLSPGDAVFFPGGMREVPRAEDQGLLVLVRLSVLPVAAPAPGAGTPATAATEPALRPTATAVAEAGGLAVGATALVTEAGVRLRGGPSTSAEVVAELESGQEVVIAGPAEEGDGIVWYPVEAVDDPAVAGYVAVEFLAPTEE